MRTTLEKQNIPTTDEQIALMVECATAAVYVGELTENQTTVFRAEIRKHHLCCATIELLAKPLIPANAKLLLRVLLDKDGWENERDTIVGVAEWVRKLKYNVSELEDHAADKATIAALKRKFELQQRQKSESPTELTKQVIDWYDVPTLHNISEAYHNNKGWAAMATERFRQLGQTPTKKEISKDARNIQNQVIAYRKKPAEEFG